MSNRSDSKKPDIDFNTQAMVRHRQFRAFKNRLATGSITAGGFSVIIAILLIFFYLLWEILPLFKAAEIEVWSQQESRALQYPSPGGGQQLILGLR